MKAVCCSFIAILFSVGGFCNEFKSKALSSFDFVSGSSVETEKASFLSKGEIVSNDQSPKELPGKTKKRNKKGVKPLLFCMLNGEKYHFATSFRQFSHFQQFIYFFQAFSGNGKRGPPFFLFQIA